MLNPGVNLNDKQSKRVRDFLFCCLRHSHLNHDTVEDVVILEFLVPALNLNSISCWV
jgi:hypothetical protein